MAKSSKISGAGSSVTASTGSRSSKDGSFLVSHPLTQSEIGWLRAQSKRVAEVSTRQAQSAPKVGTKG